MTPGVSRRHDLSDFDDATDLDDLLQNTQTLLRLSRPIIHLMYHVDNLRRWEPWTVCLVLLGITNSACLLLEDLYVMFSLLVLLCLAGLGYAHRKTNILAKVIPSTDVECNTRLTSDNLQASDINVSRNFVQSDLLEEFKFLLCFMNSITRTLAQAIIKLYAILKWENLQETIICYVAVTTFVMFFHMAPVRWSVTLLLNIFLLHYPLIQYFKVVRFLHAPVDRVDGEDHASIATATDFREVYEYSSPEEGDRSYSAALCDDGRDGSAADPTEENGSVEKSEADSSSDDASEMTRSCASNTSLASDNGSIGKGKRASVVGKILKTVKNQTSSGSCAGCNVNFTTILKRRRLCSHCGNHFCARCCSYKVTRAMFGATAPAAQTETVNVCFYCFNYLNKVYRSQGGSKTNVNSIGTAPAAGDGKQNGTSGNGTRRTKSDGSSVLCENKEKAQ